MRHPCAHLGALFSQTLDLMLLRGLGVLAFIIRDGTFVAPLLSIVLFVSTRFDWSHKWCVRTPPHPPFWPATRHIALKCVLESHLA